jgi:hypothetical protein
MRYPIKIDKLTGQTEFYSEVVDMYQEANNYLQSHEWCSVVLNCDLYTNLGDKLCIFLFKIDNSASSDDNLIWVIVGDIPPMYLDIYGPTSTKEVLNVYVVLANDWIKHVRAGKSVGDCYPFNAEPNYEYADMLERKVAFINNEIIENIDDIRI